MPVAWAAYAPHSTLWAEIEDEMTGIVLPALAAKAVLLRETQHAAVAPYDLGDHPRDAPFAAPGNQPSEQYRAARGP